MFVSVNGDKVYKVWGVGFCHGLHLGLLLLLYPSIFSILNNIFTSYLKTLLFLINHSKCYCPISVTVGVHVRHVSL